MHIYHRLRTILFFDIETVSLAENFSDLDDRGQELWSKKETHFSKEAIPAEDLYKQKAGIFAEFSKVVCISMGFLYPEKGKWQFRMKSIYGEDEIEILTEFAKILRTKFHDSTEHSLCGHNIREFDVPFLSRRMLVHGIALPPILDIRYSKPWEREHLLDTLQSWKFGDYKNYTSLDLLCYTLDVPSPKSAISGADVHDVYYVKKDIEAIAKYCEQDVVAVLGVYLKLHCIPDEEQIEVYSTTFGGGK